MELYRHRSPGRSPTIACIPSKLISVLSDHRALGKQVQTFWHEQVVDAPTPMGWGNQIRAEPGILLTYVHKRRIGDADGLQLVPHVGFSTGTIMTHVRAGGLLRYGRRMTGFGPDGIEPGGAMLKKHPCR